MSDPRNATASWSGYLHQGKVGILVALQKINELISGKTDDEINEILEKWRIIYENAEDFDVQEKDDDGLYIDSDGSWRVDSRHQVKAYKDGINLNDYKEVLRKTKYLPNGKWKCGFEISFCNNDKKYLHSICEVKGFGSSKTDYKKQQQIGKIDTRAKYIPNPNKIKLYPYPTGDYCDITSTDDKIRDWCNIEIEKIKGSNSIQNIYESLLYLLDEKIRNKHSGGSPIFSFNELFSSIVSFLTFEEYDEMRLRQSFVKYYEYFILNTQHPDGVVNIKILEEYMSSITSLNKENFYSFIREIHFYKDFVGRGSNFNEDGFGSIICDFLCKNSGLSGLEDLEALLSQKNYLLSCCSEAEERRHGVIRGLVENLNSGKLDVNSFSGKKIMNQHIDMDIEKFNDVKENYINKDWSKQIGKNDSVSRLTGASLIPKSKF